MRYFEDFTVGDEFALGQRALTREEIIAFAREWDPQAFHTGERESVFGAPLIASGVQVMGLWMRLYVDRLLHDVAVVAGKSFSVRMFAPVLPDMQLTAAAEVTALEESDRTERGVIGVRGTLHDDRGDLVWEARTESVLQRQPAQASFSAPDPQRFTFAAPGLTEAQEDALWDLDEDGEVVVLAVADDAVSVEYTGAGDAETVIAALSQAVPGLALTPAAG